MVQSDKNKHFLEKLTEDGTYEVLMPSRKLILKQVVLLCKIESRGPYQIGWRMRLAKLNYYFYWLYLYRRRYLC
ncbi:hypothetical protein SAMN04488146_101296 [Bacillus nitratireducens]|nr:hypothetical protein SAMN04488146_101296 [Bacillus nitratireducens]